MTRLVFKIKQILDLDVLGIYVEGSLQHLFPKLSVILANTEPCLVLLPGMVTTLEALLAPVTQPMAGRVSLGVLPM